MEKYDPLTERIIACCFKVHNELGPGFNERIYHKALKLSFQECNLQYEVEKEFIIRFQNQVVGSSRLDLLVENKVVVELKAIVGGMPDVFKYQILSYLKSSGFAVGLLVNFGNKSCQIKRFVL